MQFSEPLKLNHIFRRLYSKGVCVANRDLVLYCHKNRTEKNRIGITVGKKLGKAVRRNKIRRRLREIYRLNEGRFRRGYDIVVVARSRAEEATFEELTRAYLQLANKAGLLEAEK